MDGRVIFIAFVKQVSISSDQMIRIVHSTFKKFDSNHLLIFFGKPIRFI